MTPTTNQKTLLALRCVVFSATQILKAWQDEQIFVCKDEELRLNESPTFVECHEMNPHRFRVWHRLTRSRLVRTDGGRRVQVGGLEQRRPMDPGLFHCVFERSPLWDLIPTNQVFSPISLALSLSLSISLYGWRRSLNIGFGQSQPP